MTLLERASAATLWRDVFTPRIVLLVGLGVFLHSALFALFVSLYNSDGAIWQLSLTLRQSYSHAWIMAFGLACWGGAIFTVGLSLRPKSSGALRPALMFLGAGMIGLAQWSASPLPHEPAGSAMECRLHLFFGAVSLLALTRCCASTLTSIRAHDGRDVLGLCLLAAVVASASALLLMPSARAAAELVLAATAGLWTVLRLPEHCN